MRFLSSPVAGNFFLIFSECERLGRKQDILLDPELLAFKINQYEGEISCYELKAKKRGRKEKTRTHDMAYSYLEKKIRRAKRTGRKLMQVLTI